MAVLTVGIWRSNPMSKHWTVGVIGVTLRPLQDGFEQPPVRPPGGWENNEVRRVAVWDG